MNLQKAFENARDAYYKRHNIKSIDVMLNNITFEKLSNIRIINIHTGGNIDIFEDNYYKLEKNYVEERLYIYMNDFLIYEMDLSCIVSTRFYYNDENKINAIELKVNTI